LIRANYEFEMKRLSEADKWARLRKMMKRKLEDGAE
jgi:hypothetical protein